MIVIKIFNTIFCRKEGEEVQKTQYVDTELLDKYIAESGYRVGYLVKALDLSWEAFNRKRKGITPFKGIEVYVLCNLLNITEEDKPKIFCF